MLAPQHDKWHLNNNNIEFYWNHFVHSSLNNKYIYLDLKSLYDQNYMLYEKKSSVWQIFVRSDKISNSVRPMSDKILGYFDSTVSYRIVHLINLDGVGYLPSHDISHFIWDSDILGSIIGGDISYRIISYTWSTWMVWVTSLPMKSLTSSGTPIYSALW